MWKDFCEKVINMESESKIFIGFCVSVFFSYQIGYAIGKLVAHLT